MSDIKKGRKKMSKKTKYFLIVFAISIVLSIFAIPKIIISLNQGLVESELVINEVDTTNIPDGTYSASFSAEQMGATVNVTLYLGRITAIEFTDCKGIDLTRANEIIDDVIEYQMLNSPQFPNYTYSDKILLKTIEAALDNQAANAA
ncbi:MAG: hypothetical protein LBL82_07195 [Oscillospiraceae bacterium]|jgi:uncharacterized protein with FMN-binding domain|nr:hypothetical protein [Oscillospiraceae bacterium]